MKRTSSMTINPTDESRELYLYAVNSSNIYFRYMIPVTNVLSKKAKRSAYDTERAIDAWYTVATAASKAYQKDFGYSFSVNERFNAAIELEQSFIDDVFTA